MQPDLGELPRVRDASSAVGKVGRLLYEASGWMEADLRENDLRAECAVGKIGGRAIRAIAEVLENRVHDAPCQTKAEILTCSNS
jgi:hypothetical protein